MSLQINDNKVLKKYEAICTKIEDLKNIKLDILPVCDDRYRKAKLQTYGNNIYINFRGLSVPEDGVECEVFFTVICIDFLLVYNNKYYQQVYVEYCAYKVVNTQMIDYLDENLFESDGN